MLENEPKINLLVRHKYSLLLEYLTYACLRRDAQQTQLETKRHLGFGIQSKQDSLNFAHYLYFQTKYLLYYRAVEG